MKQSSDVQRLLADFDQTFAEQAGIELRDKPSPLFRLLVLTSLLSANLDARLGLRTARALSKAGFTTAQHLADASDDDRWQVLSESKYLRKKQTARQLGQLADEAVERYAGDLRQLRDESTGADSARDIRDAVQEFTGIGPLGADIFCREAQAVWPVLRPYADDRVLDLARDRGLPHTVDGLVDAAGTDDLSRLGAALVTADREDRNS